MTERGRQTSLANLGDALANIARAISPFPAHEKSESSEIAEDGVVGTDGMVELPAGTPPDSPGPPPPPARRRSASLGERIQSAFSSRTGTPPTENSLEADATPVTLGRQRRKSWVELSQDAIGEAVGTITRTIVDSIPGMNSLSIDFKDEDLMKRSQKKFLDAYTEHDIAHFLKEFGIKDDLSAQGYSNVVFKIDLSDNFVHRLTVSDESLMDGSGGPLRDDQFICDCFVRHKDLVYHGLHAYQEMARLADPESRENMLRNHTYTGLHDISMEEAAQLRDFLHKHFEKPVLVTHIDWICLQNPRIPFQDNRPPLPGQKYPGLRAAKKVMVLLEKTAQRRQRDALSNTPDQFFNAFIYQARGWRYVNPAFEGFFSAVVSDLTSNLVTLGLAPVAWAFFLGHVSRRTDPNDPSKTERVAWNPMEEQLYATNTRMTEYFSSKAYLDIVEQYKTRYQGHFFIDWEKARPDAELAMAARAKSPKALPISRPSQTPLPIVPNDATH